MIRSHINADSSLKVVYRPARETAKLNWFGALGSIGMLAFVLWMRWNKPPQTGGEQASFYLLLLFTICSSILFIVMLRHQRGYVVLLDSGIQQYLPNGSSLYLSWPEIKEIRENKIRGRLELIPIDNTNLKMMKVDYQLQNFARLKTLLYEKTNSDDRDLLLSEFHRSKGVQILMIIAGTVFGVPGIILLLKGRLAPAFILFLFTWGARFAYRSEISSVTIHDDHLSVNYPKRSRRIYFSSIKNLKLVSPKGVAIVSLEVDDKEIILGGFQERSISLYRKLSAVVPGSAQTGSDFNQRVE